MARQTIEKLIARKDLTRDEARELMHAVMRGELEDCQIASVLTALRMKGETVDEIAGFAFAMREKALAVLQGQIEAEKERQQIAIEGGEVAAEAKRKQLGTNAGMGPDDWEKALEAQQSRERELIQLHHEEMEADAKSHASELDKIRKRKEKDERNHTSAMIRMAEAGNTSATALLKAYALDQAKILGKSAIVGAYRWGANIGGPVAGAAAAATASLAVGALINAINSAGETGGVSGAAANAGSTLGDGGGLQDVETAPERSGNVLSVNIVGNVIGNEEFVQNVLIPELRSAIEERDEIIISGDTRQALEFAS